MLRGVIAIVACVVALVYIVLDYVSNIHSNFVFYIILLGLSIITFWLNRIRFYTWSSFTLILLSNGITYIFSSSEHLSSGDFFFFLVTGLGTMVLFGYNNRHLGFLLTAVSFLIAVIAFSGVLPFRSFITYTDEYLRLSFITNFTLSYLMAILIIYFSIQLHQDTETNLRTSEQSLLLTSEELKHSRERFQMAIEGSKAAIYEWNKKTGSVYLTPHYKNLLGYGTHDLQDFTVDKLFEMIHQDDLPCARESFHRHLLTRRPYKIELRMMTSSGSYKWVSNTGTSKFNERGEQILIVGSIVDIDERKMAEQQIRLQNDLLAKANDELDRFVYSASHDLRAPLSSLLGLISVAEKTGDSSEIALCLEMMKKRVLTMENFIKEITDYSRNSRLGVEHKPVKVHQLVLDIVESLKFTHGAERIAIDLDIVPELTFITDDNRLKVIVNNLVANAIRYHALSKPDPFIQIKAYQKDDEYLLSVQDNGQGISDEHRDKIFNMFYRASENSEGSGLGLYIVKETLAKLQGRIDVTSMLYEGTTFSISLPVNAPENESLAGNY